MKPVRHFANAILLLCLPLAISVLGPGPQSLAQDGSEVRGAKGPIGKEDLLAALRRQKTGGTKVAGHIVAGPDVIDILSQGDVPIELRDCVIEDGLVFLHIAVVRVPITLENCEIGLADMPRKFQVETSIHARDIRFEGEVIVQSSTVAGLADFTGAEFRKKARLPGSQFPGGASFAGVQFSEAAHFSRSHFSSVQFDTASFHGNAAFRRAVFDSTAYFDRATFSAQADFRRAVFRAEQSFFATFQGPVWFGEARFEDAASFSGQIFPEVARFDKAEFSGQASFADARFQKRASFGNTQFVDDTDFAGAAFEQPANFQRAEFLGESDFSASLFRDKATFFGSRFHGPVLFRHSEARRFASFRSAEFDDEVRFNGSVFGESADFQGTRFKGLLTLTGADFGAYADFRDSQIALLDLNSIHNPTILRSRLDMRGARIGDALLQDVIFEADADFSDASFGQAMPSEDSQAAVDPAAGTTIIRFATFEGNVSFARTRFAGRLALENVKFQGSADFTDADFGGIERDGAPSFVFSYVDFEDLRLRWPQLPEPRYWAQSQDEVIYSAIEAMAPLGQPEPLSRTLAELEAHFRAANRLEDANAAYYERKLAELREVRSGGWDWARFLLEVEWLFWGLVCGYGTKLWWALGWALLVDAIFTLVYWSSATVTRLPHPDAKEEFSFRLRLLDLPKQYATDRADLPVQSARLRKLVNSLRVSSVILFKLGYRDTTLAGHVGPLPIAYLVAVEWALGFYLLAAFTVTLANTQPLINRLLSGVF